MVNSNISPDAPALSGHRAAGNEFTYKAFISYSHKDEQAAKKLRRSLERYRTPKSLRNDGATLGAIFRDRDELPAASHLNKTIKTALRASENLIVMCSPNAAASRWVNEEITYFKSLGRDGHIFSVILSGVPNAADNGLDKTPECLPHALRYESDEDGSFSTDPVEPLAADFRKGGDGEKLGTLKIISGLLGVGLDALLQRQLIRTRRRMIGVATAASIIVSLLAGLTWTAYHAQNQAEARRADAENFVEFLLSDLSAELESYGKLSLLDTVGEKAINYYTQFEEDDFDSNVNSRRARTLQFMGELQDALGKTEESQKYFNQAYTITQSGLSQDVENPDRIFEHARSVFLRSLPVRRTGDYAGELVHLREYFKLCQKLESVETGSDRAINELALAKMNLGRVYYRTGEIENAKREFAGAENQFGSLTNKGFNLESLLNQAENMAWHAEAYRSTKDYQKNYDIRSAQVALLERRLSQAPSDFRLMEGLVYAKLGFGNAARRLDFIDEAKTQLSSALSETQTALNLEPNREKMKRAQSAVLIGLMSVAIQDTDVGSYHTARDKLTTLHSAVMETDIGENRYWNEIVPKTLATIDAEFKNQLGTAQ